MEYITLAIAIIGSTIGVISFFNSRKDKSNQETEKDSYKWGQIDIKLANIEKCLDKIEKKLDTYDKEIDEKIHEALEHHILEYHKEK